MKPAVYIVDDEEPVRRSTRLMLMMAGYEVQVFEGGGEFLEVADGLRPGVVLLDLRMPGLDGLEVQRRLAANTSHKVVMLTGHGDIGVAVSAFEQGASGFLEKPFPKQNLLDALERAFLKLEDPEAATRLTKEAVQRIAGLNPTERQLLVSLARGLSNDAIGISLGLEIGAVEMHRAKLLSSLGVTTLVDALTLAFEAGVSDEIGG